MAKNDSRFTVVYKDGSELGESGSRRILVDKETGVITSSGSRAMQEESLPFSEATVNPLSRNPT